jgi:aspartyl-tRNA(Asn)/glutamyl-tRNA(Gln) amidotransferase subunit A
MTAGEPELQYDRKFQLGKCDDMEKTCGLVSGTAPLVADPGSILDIAAAIASGRLGVGDMLEASLSRIDAVEHAVQGWCVIDRDGARTQAQMLSEEARAGKLRGPLHGIPVAIKDVIDVRGLPTRAGSATRAQAPVAGIDAQVVAQLRAGGAIVLGKVHTTEFAYFDGPPPTRNPWNLAHTPGGSSSGPAAVVAAGMVPLALGTQTAGSVSRPAAYCGIAAFKPSTRAWSSFGVVPFSPMFDTVGVFGYRVADAVAAARVLMPRFLGRDVAQANPPLIGLIDDPILQNASALVAQTIETAVLKLREAGVDVQRRSSPTRFSEIIAWHRTVTEYELARAHPELAATEREVTPALRDAVRRGQAIEQAIYEHAVRAVDAAAERFWATMHGLDALIFPAAPDLAPPGMKTGDPSFIIPFTALGGPIVSVPVAVAPQGLPLGLMLIGAPGTDRAIATTAERLAGVIELFR